MTTRQDEKYATEPNNATIKRRAARLGILPRDLDDALQMIRERLLVERPAFDVVNVMIRRRLIAFAAREYGRRTPDGKRGRGTAYRSAFGNRNSLDYNARDSVGRIKYEHIDATPDHADAAIFSADMQALIKRADGRIKPQWYAVLIADVRGIPTEVQAARARCSESTIQNWRNAAYAILRRAA